MSGGHCLRKRDKVVGNEIRSSKINKRVELTGLSI